MKILFYLVISRVYAALPSIPGKKPEDYKISDISILVLYFIKLFFVTTISAAMIMLIWGAIQYLTAYGNEEKAQRGKTIMVWAIVGLVVAILAWVIINEVLQLLGAG